MDRQHDMSVKALSDTRIGGYGVVWGGRDLTGVDHFEKDTDFWFDRISPRPMMLYAHGQNKGLKRAVLGHIDTLATDDYGLWIEGEIKMAEAYARLVKPLIEKGVLGWSAGAVPHLVERGNGGKIKSWPTVEFSLTPIPFEPRTLGVHELRALAELEPALKAFTEADGTSADDASEARARAIEFLIPSTY